MSESALQEFLLFIARHNGGRGQFAVVSRSVETALHNVIEPMAREVPENISVTRRDAQRLRVEVFGCRVTVITERDAREGYTVVRGQNLTGVFVDPLEDFRDPDGRLPSTVLPCLVATAGEIFGARHLLECTNFTSAFQSLLTEARAIRRRAWPDGSWLVLVPGSRITVEPNRPLGRALPHLMGRQVRYSSHIDLVRDDHSVRPWTPTQEDLLATDWAVR